MLAVSHVLVHTFLTANMKYVILLACLAVACARPQEQKPPVPIVSSNSEVNGDGTYNFDFETGDGVKRQESGNQKQITPEAAGQIQKGGYSYTAPDGQVISLSFVADENGFQPVGDHLPVAPPLPPAIARALAQIARANAGPGAGAHHH